MLARTAQTFPLRPVAQVSESAIDELLKGLIDYAGLFPPAKLSLPAVAENYFTYQISGRAAALGRLIVNCADLPLLAAVTQGHSDRLPLSVIVKPGDEAAFLSALEEGISIEAAECRLTDRSDIDWLIQCLPAHIERYVEISTSGWEESIFATLAANDLHAKIRMGGVTSDTTPAANEVANLLKGLAKSGIPFKATAGLHRPVRSRRNFSDNVEAPMHGFLNLAFAAGLVFLQAAVEEAVAVLSEENPSAFRFETDALHWRDRAITKAQIAALRSDFFLSFGSCSFEEPFADLEMLGWL